MFFFAGVSTPAQETDSQNIPDTSQDAPVENVKTPPPKQEPKKKAQPKAEASKQKTESKIQSLLPVTEGNFKYIRIPGIKLPQNAPMGDISHASEELQKEPVRIVEDEKKPFLWGAGSDLIKVLILLLILAIFVFYRINSKKNRRHRYYKR